MAHRTPALVAVALAIHALAACASATGRHDAAAPPAPPLPRSSIAAVLARSGELGLSDVEVARLTELDAVLAKERAQIVAEREPAATGGERGRGTAPAGPPGRPPPGGPGPHAPGQEPGAEPGRPGERAGPAPGAADAAVTRRLDDADTRAYLRAEEALSPAHRERAREIAADYRAALFDARERARKHR